jgi:hypothetical protein
MASSFEDSSRFPRSGSERKSPAEAGPLSVSKSTRRLLLTLLLARLFVLATLLATLSRLLLLLAGLVVLTALLLATLLAALLAALVLLAALGLILIAHVMPILGWVV